MERTNVCVGATMSAIRVCRERGCITNLSRFNPGTYCWEHTPDLTQTDRPAQHVRLQGQISTQGIMSDAFLEGIGGTYKFTASERARWARGA